jgi:hypothetical protein
MHDQPIRATTAATADMFDLIEADLLRILRRRARLGDLRLPEPGRPRPPQAARQPVAGGQGVGTPRLRVRLAGVLPRGRRGTALNAGQRVAVRRRRIKAALEESTHDHAIGSELGAGRQRIRWRR